MVHTPISFDEVSDSFLLSYESLKQYAQKKEKIAEESKVLKELAIDLQYRRKEITNRTETLNLRRDHDFKNFVKAGLAVPEFIRNNFTPAFATIESDLKKINKDTELLKKKQSKLSLMKEEFELMIGLELDKLNSGLD